MATDVTSDTQLENKDKGTGRDLNVVNPQIVDAVRTSTQYTFGVADILPPSSQSSGGDGNGNGDSTQFTISDPADPTGSSNAYSATAFNAGTPIAYQKASQALAFSVQDAVDYQRNVLSMTSAAEGKALQLMFEDIANENPVALGEHAVVYILAMVGGLAGGLVAEYITNESGKALAAFPKT
jgi:hypothetical protein